MDNKPIVLYHQIEKHIACDDGWGAAFVAMLHFGKDGAEFVPLIYRDQQLALDIFRGRDVYFLDCAYGRSYMDDISIVSKSLTVLDHHKTSIEQLGDAHYFCGNYEQSGAMLAWKYFFPDRPVPLLIHHIDDNDRWVHQDPYSKAFLERVRSFPKTFGSWSTLYMDLGCDRKSEAYQQFVREGLVLLDALNLKSEIYATQAFPIRLYGKQGAAVCCNRFFESVLGDIVAEKAQFACIFYFIDADTVSVSLRSAGFDVEQIARFYGGGGHHKAAGFSISSARWFSILSGDEEQHAFFQDVSTTLDDVRERFVRLPAGDQTVATLDNLLNDSLDAKYPHLTGAHAMVHGTSVLASVGLDHLYLRPIAKLKARLAKVIGLPVFSATKRWYHRVFGYAVETPVSMSDFTVKELLNTYSSVDAELLLKKSLDSGYIAHLPQPYKEFTMTVHYGSSKHSVTFRS